MIKILTILFKTLLQASGRICLYTKKCIYSAGPKSCYPPPIFKKVTFSELCSANYVNDRKLFFCNKLHISEIRQKNQKIENYVQNRP